MRPDSIFKPRPGNNGLLNAKIGKKLKMLRVDKGMSQMELADKMGVSQVTICRVERGYDNISLSKIDSMVRALRARFSLEFPLDTKVDE